MRSEGRIRRGAAIALVVLVVLPALAGVLLPKFLNARAFRAAMERRISQGLGGRVTFGHMGLTLFPQPTLGLRDVTMEIPGSVSATVADARVAVRFLPLLRGRFAVESATLDRPAVVLTVPGPSVAGKPANRSPGEILAAASRAVPGLSLRISRGGLSLLRDGQTALALRELEARLAFVPAQPAADGPSGGPSAVRFHVAGEAQAVIGAIEGPLRPPIRLADVHLRTFGAGPGLMWELTGSVAVQGATTIPFTLRQESGRISLEKLQVKDGVSDALLSGAAGETGFDLAFAGTLDGSSLMGVLERGRVPFKSIEGDVRVHVPRGRWGEATGHGVLEGRSLVVPFGLAGALTVDRFSFRAEGRTLRLLAPAVALDGRAATDVALSLSAADGRTTVNLEHASVCGISLAGSLRVDGGEVDVALRPRARGRELDEDLRCLFHSDLLPSGSYDLSGGMTARGTRDTLLASLRGDFDVTARKGLVRNTRVVEGVIAYLEKSGSIEGSEADNLRAGIPYQTIKLRGTLRGGVVELANLSVRSKGIQVVAEGEVGLRGRTLDLKILVAPLGVADRVLGKIPVVRHIVGDGLVVVPVRVAGSFDKPEVKHLPASAVGASVANLMKNIVQAPVKIVDPPAP